MVHPLAIVIFVTLGSWATLNNSSEHINAYNDFMDNLNSFYTNNNNDTIPPNARICPEKNIFGHRPLEVPFEIGNACKVTFVEDFLSCNITRDHMFRMACFVHDQNDQQLEYVQSQAEKMWGDMKKMKQMFDELQFEDICIYVVVFSSLLLYIIICMYKQEGRKNAFYHEKGRFGLLAYYATHQVADYQHHAKTKCKDLKTDDPFYKVLNNIYNLLHRSEHIARKDEFNHSQYNVKGGIVDSEGTQRFENHKTTLFHFLNFWVTFLEQEHHNEISYSKADFDNFVRELSLVLGILFNAMETLKTSDQQYAMLKNPPNFTGSVNYQLAVDELRTRLSVL